MGSQQEICFLSFATIVSKPFLLLFPPQKDSKCPIQNSYPSACDNGQVQLNLN
jgi:hypothetical protein